MKKGNINEVSESKGPQHLNEDLAVWFGTKKKTQRK